MNIVYSHDLKSTACPTIDLAENFKHHFEKFLEYQ